MASTSSVAYTQGYNAAKAGGNPQDNPYQYGTGDWNDWGDGFLKAIKEEMH